MNRVKSADDIKTMWRDISFAAFATSSSDPTDDDQQRDRRLAQIRELEVCLQSLIDSTLAL